MTASTRLGDELGLDSASLIELTVLVHTLYGVDLGRRAVEHKGILRHGRRSRALLGAP